MRKKHLIIFIIAFPIFFMNCATIDLKELNPVGKIYRNSIQLEEKNIPLPDGEWKVIARGNRNNSFQDPYFDIILLKEYEAKKVHSFLYLTTESMSNNYNGYKPNEYLTRKDIHHAVVKNNETGYAQDGWIINHYLLSIDPEKRPPLLEAYNYLSSNKISIPKIMIQTFHHFTGKYRKNKILQVSYYLNPEIEGFESSNETNWGTSEWHPLRIDNDPKKKAYIERLKEEGAIMHEKIRAGFGD